MQGYKKQLAAVVAACSGCSTTADNAIFEKMSTNSYLSLALVTGPNT